MFQKKNVEFVDSAIEIRKLFFWHGDIIIDISDFRLQFFKSNLWVVDATAEQAFLYWKRL